MRYHNYWAITIPNSEESKFRHHQNPSRAHASLFHPDPLTATPHNKFAGHFCKFVISRMLHKRNLWRLPFSTEQNSLDVRFGRRGRLCSAPPPASATTGHLGSPQVWPITKAMAEDTYVHVFVWC